MNFSAMLRKAGGVCPALIFFNRRSIIWLMRVSIIISFVLLCSFELLSANVSKAQDIHVDQVNIGLQNASLVQALKQIEQQTTLRFFYRKADLKQLPPVDLPPETRTVERTLQLLLANTFISFRQLESNVLLERNAYQTGYEIKGRVVDMEHKGIPFATAILKKRGDRQILNAVQADNSGQFLLKATDKGDYLVSLSSVGMDSSTVSVSLSGMRVIQLPEITLNKKVTHLGEVTVTANKPMLERKIDRMVFNLPNSIAAKGLDLSQALALTPMLRVTDNGVSVVGKSGVSVMINDRILNISGADLINYLRSLRSDDVEKIEVITTPPAKYEAQGNSGLINIVLKKNQSLGWSGNASSSYQQATYGGYGNDLNINYQSKKLSTSLKLRRYDRTTHPTEEINVIGRNSILSSDSRKDMVHGYGGNLSTNYHVNEKADIGLIYDLGQLHYDMDINNRTVYRTDQITDSVLNTFSQQRNTTLTHTLNVYYDQKLDKSGKKISTGINYFSTAPKNEVDFRTTSERTAMTDLVRNFSDLNYKIWSAQTDLTLPYRWANVETGTKFTNFDNNSDIGYYNLINGNYALDPAKSNLFNYDEKNIAGYISLQKDLGKKWSTKAGLRYEYSMTNGYSPGTGETSRNRYGKSFPSVYLTYKPNTDHTFSLNYSKRINRPSFRALNPFRWYSNPYTYSTGNPFLQPSFNDNFELAYLFKGIFSITLYEQKLSNGFGRIVEVDNALKTVNYKNYLSQYNTGVEASLSFKPFPWWENREFLSYSMVHGRSALAEVLLQDGSSVYYSTYNTFVLSKKVNVFLNFFQTLPSTQGNVYSKSIYDLSAGIKLGLMNNKMQLNASVDDILKSYVSRGDLYFKDLTQTYNNYYDQRRSTISLIYTFGRSKVTGNKKQVNFRETQRAN